MGHDPDALYEMDFNTSKLYFNIKIDHDWKTFDHADVSGSTRCTDSSLYNQIMSDRLKKCMFDLI